MHTDFLRSSGGHPSSVVDMCLPSILDPEKIVSVIIEKLKEKSACPQFIKCLALIGQQFSRNFMLYRSVISLDDTPLDVIESHIPRVFVSFYMEGGDGSVLNCAFEIIKDIRAIAKLMLINGYSAEQACEIHFKEPRASGTSVEFCM